MCLSFTSCGHQLYNTNDCCCNIIVNRASNSVEYLNRLKMVNEICFLNKNFFYSFIIHSFYLENKNVYTRPALQEHQNHGENQRMQDTSTHKPRIYISCNIRNMGRIRGCRTPLLINLEYIYLVIIEPWRELEDVGHLYS